MKKLLLLLFFLPHLISAQSMVINEIMSSNINTIFDEDGDTPDWIELYNNSTETLNLLGYSLSDDSLDIKKWQFGDAVVDPGEYLVIFASDKDTHVVYWHTNFKLSATLGERLILSDSSGSVVDFVDIPVSQPDVSFGRIQDGSIPWLFLEPSPGSQNNIAGILGYADSVLVSMPGGFYSSVISVTLSASDSDIFYTLDGSDPHSGSMAYSGPIDISETTVLKAISTKANHYPSPIVYRSYFINEQTDLPVISLSTDPDNLFDPDSGIYENYEEDWERPAHIEFFDDDKNIGFSENVGINIYGGYTRRFAQKSLAVKFKNEYGKSKLEYDLFPGFELKSFKSFILRNSGNDFEQTHIRDAFMQTLVKDLDVEYLEYRPAVTFINGEYWGIYNIREKINEHYIASRHGVDPDNIDMMEGYSAYNDDENDPDGEYGLWVGNLDAIHGDTIHYKQLIDYLYTEDLTTEAAYTTIDSMIDIDECLLYYAAHVYYNSQDWPANNSRYWRERSSEGRWRWILYDLDFGFNLYEWNNEGNWENHVDYLFSGDPSQRPWSKPVESTFIPRKIVENPQIKNQFVNQVADLLNTNFKTDRVLNVMNTIADHIADDIDRHRARFGIWGDNLNRMISFAENRPDYLRDHVRDFFDSGEDGSITINSSEGGSVRLNTLQFTVNDLPWSGVYFQENNVHLKAVPDAGYKFDGWSGTITSEEISIEVSGMSTVNLTAAFSIDNSVAKDIVINEINYNSAGDFDPGDWIELYNKSDQSINIGDWFFSDSVESHKYFFPAGTTVGPDEYLVLVQSDSAFSMLFPDVENYIGETGFGLAGSGELIRLVNEEGQIIDSLTYDDELPWPLEADGLGATLELIDPESDNSIAENWKASQGHGTPGAQNSPVTSSEQSKSIVIPSEFSLSQNYPNPFNPTTIINYELPITNHVDISIYSTLGQKVATLVSKKLPAGKYKVEFDGSDFSSGIYLYQMRADHYVETKKFILLK